MRRAGFLTLLFISLQFASVAAGQTVKTPEAKSAVVDIPRVDTLKPADCMTDVKGAAASVDYGGKSYYFKSQACKEQFLTDPERYSQLYDALAELKNAGKPLQKPKSLDNASAVPS
jgi:YHS domain-containing protein